MRTLCCASLQLTLGFGGQRFAICLPQVERARERCSVHMAAQVFVLKLLPICLVDVFVMFRFCCHLFCVAGTLVLPVAAGHARIDVRMESSLLPLAARTQLSSSSGVGFLGVAKSLSGGTRENAGPEFERETQAPLIWMNLHKPAAGSVDGAPIESFDSFAAQRVAQTDLRK